MAPQYARLRGGFAADTLIVLPSANKRRPQPIHDHSAHLLKDLFDTFASGYGVRTPGGNVDMADIIVE